MQTDTVSMMNIKHFIRVNKITMTATRAESDPNMEATAAGSMDHWKVTLVRKVAFPLPGCVPDHYSRTARLTTYFSMGYGHNGAEPTVSDVLDSLASDASLAGDNSFEDFCSELGYDSDSRKVEKSYKACKHSAGRLKKFLGGAAYETLLYKTERQ